MSIKHLHIIPNGQDLKYFGKGSKVFGMTVLIVYKLLEFGQKLSRDVFEKITKVLKESKTGKKMSRKKKAEPAAQQPARPSRQPSCQPRPVVTSG